MIPENIKSELEDWFNPDKYNECIKFSYKQWFTELTIRKEVLIAIIDNNFNTSKVVNDSDLKELLVHIKSNKFFIDNDNIDDIITNTKVKLSGYDKKTYTELKEIGLVQNHLWSTSYEDLHTRNFISSYSKVNSRDCISKTEDAVVFDAIHKNNFRMGNDDVTKFNSLATLRVDLNQNTTLLCNDFKAWIKSAKKHGQITTIQQGAKEDWATYKLLGWFDLEIFCASKGSNLGGIISKNDAFKLLHKNLDTITKKNHRDKLTSLMNNIINEELLTRLNYKINS